MQQIQVQGFDEMPFEYRNNLIQGVVYDSSGNFSTILVLNKNYEIVFGPNDFTAKLGFGGTAQNFAPPPSVFYFTASNSNALALTGVPNATATVQLYQLN